MLDTKWKLVKSSDSDHNYNISQSDIYQLFAHSNKYLGCSGDMMLIYPKHHQFNIPLECFDLAEELRLWAIPFCIATDKLITGKWIERFPSLS